MEDTHWDGSREYSALSDPVLILVLMEDTHWDLLKVPNLEPTKRLNPCFNGRYSLSAFEGKKATFTVS